MIWVAIAGGLVLASAAIMLMARKRRDAVLLDPALAKKLAATIAAMRDAEPWRPSAAADAPPGAAAIEAALIAGDAPKALALAETALTAEPDRWPVAILPWLGWALCANGQPAAALAQLARNVMSAASEERMIVRDVIPLDAYVTARAQHLVFEHQAGAEGPVPPLVTTADLAVVTLARGGGATWIAGSGDGELTEADVRAAIAEHRRVTESCVLLTMHVLAAHPGFAEAGYLLARLAVKAGHVRAARELFALLAPRMVGRPDAAAFARDRKDLDDPAGAVAAATSGRVPPTAKRSRSLKVLS